MKYYGTEISIENNNSVFGDGKHESTLIVLEALHRQNLNNKSVLDIGTGTGIQSIYAKKWGASEVLAVDIDYQCIFTARRNFAANHVEVKSRLNIFNEHLDFKADITVANLPAHALREYLSMAHKTMTDDGVIVFSWDNSFDLCNEIPQIKTFTQIDHIKGVEWDAYTFRR